MPTSRLSIYNRALAVLGERSLASLTENRPPRRYLDEVWQDGGVNHCLENGQWNFAMRAAQIPHDPDMEPAYGLNYAFPKPDDWMATSSICNDEFYTTPLLQYADEATIWYADITPLYVKYVSNDASYGLNFATWPDTFTDYVAHYFAGRVCNRLTGNAKLTEQLLAVPNGLVQKTLVTAKNRDLQAKPPQRPAVGNWVRNRAGGWNGGPFGDGGTTGSLIG